MNDAHHFETHGRKNMKTFLIHLKGLNKGCW